MTRWLSEPSASDAATSPRKESTDVVQRVVLRFSDEGEPLRRIVLEYRSRVPSVYASTAETATAAPTASDTETRMEWS
jgi:hypothetical protein